MGIPREMFVKVNASALGANTLIAAVAGKSFKILEILLAAHGDVDSTLESGTGGANEFIPVWPHDKCPGFHLEYLERGHFQTVPGEVLNLNLSAAVQVVGFVKYNEVS